MRKIYFSSVHPVSLGLSHMFSILVMCGIFIVLFSAIQFQTSAHHAKFEKLIVKCITCKTTHILDGGKYIFEHVQICFFFSTNSIAYRLHEVSFDTSALAHFYRNVCLIKVHQKNDLLRHVRRYHFLLKELCPD